MSFDKHYPKRKDWRTPYRDSRRFDRSCRNQGGCAWCRDARLRYRRVAVLLLVEGLHEMKTADDVQRARRGDER